MPLLHLEVRLNFKVIDGELILKCPSVLTSELFVMLSYLLFKVLLNPDNLLPDLSESFSCVLASFSKFSYEFQLVLDIRLRFVQ